MAYTLSQYRHLQSAQRLRLDAAGKHTCGTQVMRASATGLSQHDARDGRRLPASVGTAALGQIQRCVWGAAADQIPPPSPRPRPHPPRYPEPTGARAAAVWRRHHERPYTRIVTQVAGWVLTLQWGANDAGPRSTDVRVSQAERSSGSLGHGTGSESSWQPGPP